jgi:hypothetical protein
MKFFLAGVFAFVFCLVMTLIAGQIDRRARRREQDGEGR